MGFFFRRRPHFLKNLSTREANSCLLKLSSFEKYPDVSIHLRGMDTLTGELTPSKCFDLF